MKAGVTFSLVPRAAGYDVTRAGTLRQAEGTALATMPEIVLIDGEWKLDATDGLGV